MIHEHLDGTIEFAYFRPGATCVELAGDFNGWGSPLQRLTRDESGWWRARVELAPGEYRFKYLIDGAIWEADYASYGVENDRHGGWTSVVWIDARKRAGLVSAAA